ncbi:MAG TPA: hypothetical protein PLU50_09115, partial [Pseudobdellovibrionaceae bacterium]|nr:hypothetical protein [Pseudobdellovibrionaceae bacterium]
MAMDAIRQRNYQESREIQNEYEDKKKRMISQQEEELQGIRDNYESRKDHVREQGEAVINHIKDDQVKVNEEGRRQLRAITERQREGLDATVTKYNKELTD